MQYWQGQTHAGMSQYKTPFVQQAELHVSVFAASVQRALLLSTFVLAQLQDPWRLHLSAAALSLPDTVL